LSSHISSPRGQARQDLLPGIELRSDQPDQRPGAEVWAGHLRAALAARSPRAGEIAEEGLRAWPIDPELLLLATLTALANNRPEHALALLKRYCKRFVSNHAATLLTALALGQQDEFTRAWTLLTEHRMATYSAAEEWFVGDDIMADWLYAQLRAIRLGAARIARSAQTAARVQTKHVAAGKRAVVPQTHEKPRPTVVPLQPPAVPDLPRLEARFEIAFELANPETI
jgi:predicted Zn-dependent protease